jgi:hypothetical protein
VNEQHSGIAQAIYLESYLKKKDIDIDKRLEQQKNNDDGASSSGKSGGRMLFFSEPLALKLLYLFIHSFIHCVSPCCS